MARLQHQTSHGPIVYRPTTKWSLIKRPPTKQPQQKRRSPAKIPRTRAHLNRCFIGVNFEINKFCFQDEKSWQAAGFAGNHHCKGRRPECSEQAHRPLKGSPATQTGSPASRRLTGLSTWLTGPGRKQGSPAAPLHTCTGQI